MKDNSKKSLIYSILGILALITAVGTISYSFFTYVGVQDSVNYITTGSVNFKFDSGDEINLTNAYPVSSDSEVTGDDSSAIINFDVQHEYEKGVKYEIVMQKVTSGANATTLAIPDSCVKAKVTFAQGTYTGVTFTANGDFATGASLTGISTGKVHTNGDETGTSDVDGILLASGTIAKSTEALKPSITIKMWLDSSTLHISDTVKRATEDEISLGDTTPGTTEQSGNTCYPASSNTQYIVRTSEFNNKTYSTRINIYVWELTA